MINDPFTISMGEQVRFLEGAFVSYAKGWVMTEIKAKAAWFFGTPVIGPFFSFIIGYLVSKILGLLAHNAELQAYFVNTRRRADEQAKRFDELVEARARAQTPEELERAEDNALKSFNDVVKYST